MTRGRRHTFKKSDYYFIQGHCNKMTLEEIGEELEIKNLDQLAEVVAEFKTNSIPKAYEQMVKKDNIAVAMTPAASQMGDEERKKSNPSKRTQECLHVINKDRE